MKNLFSDFSYFFQRETKMGGKYLSFVQVTNDFKQLHIN